MQGHQVRRVLAGALLLILSLMAGLMFGQVVVAGVVPPRESEAPAYAPEPESLRDWVWRGRWRPIRVSEGFRAVVLADPAAESQINSFLAAIAAREVIGGDQRLASVTLWEGHELIGGVFESIAGPPEEIEYDPLMPAHEEERLIEDGDLVHYAGAVWVQAGPSAENGAAVVMRSSDGTRVYVLSADDGVAPQ